MKITQAELARRLQVSRQRVSKMVQEKLIVLDDYRKIDLDKAMAAIAKHKDLSRGGKQKPGIGSFHEFRTRKEKALARLREIEVGEKKGTLVNAADMQRVLEAAFLTIKSRLRAIPSKSAQELYNTAKKKKQRPGCAAISKILLREIDEVLLELSQPETFTK